MSERASCFAIVLCLLAAVPAGAQDTASLRAKLDSIGAEYRSTGAALQAHRRAAAQARAARFAEVLDTAVVGPFRVVARERELPVAVRHFTAAWSRVAPVLGELQAAVPPRTFLVAVTTSVPVFESMRSGNEDVVWLRRGRLGRVREGAAEAAIRQVLVELIPQVVRSWYGGYFDDPTRWDAVYRDLTMSAAIPSHDCLQGDAGACLVALGLDAGEAGAETWYPVRYLQSRALARPGVAGNPDRTDCRRGDAAACVRLLPPPGFPPPLSRVSRAAFAQLALERGGEGGYERLAMDTSATVADRLAAAAGMPLEQLVLEWRALALRARPHAYAGLELKLGATLFWSLVFLWLAARSTRCRAG